MFSQALGSVDKSQEANGTELDKASQDTKIPSQHKRPGLLIQLENISFKAEDLLALQKC